MTAVRENPAKTREAVAKLEKENKSAKEIAAALDISTATVYNHIRALHPDAPRKRGRPRKSDAEKAATPAAAKPAPKRRGRPPKSATAPAPVAQNATSNGNGVHVDLSELRTEIQSMIEVKQAEVAKLREMLALTK